MGERRIVKVTLRIRIGSTKPKIIQGIVGSNFVGFIFGFALGIRAFKKIPGFRQRCV